MNWHIGKYTNGEIVFDLLPKIDESVWIDSDVGIGEASLNTINPYTKDQFRFFIDPSNKKGKGHQRTYAWMPKNSHNRPERSKREDLLELIKNMYLPNTEF
jgi:hypothetical protein